MVRCDKGHAAPAIRTGIIDGKFGNYCVQHIQEASRLAGGQSAQWHRDRDMEEHRRDVLQPKDPKTGKPNPEFIREFPEEAAQIFTQEDMRKYGR